MQLTKIDPGEERIIFKTLTEESARVRLEELGIASGEQVKIISCELGMVLIEIRGNKLAIDRETAECILVY